MSASTTVAEIVATLPTPTVWDEEPHGFVPADTPACADTAARISVADMTGPRAAAMAEEIAAYQRENCARCPILVQCASHALVHEPYGLWGLTEQQRYALGGVLPPDWPEMETGDPVAVLSAIDGTGLTLVDIRDILDEADRMRRIEQAKAKGRKTTKVTALPEQDQAAAEETRSVQAAA